MGEDKILKGLHDAIMNYDSEAAVSASKAAIAAKVDPLMAIQKGLVPAIEEIGDKFEKMEIYLPELMLAAEAMKASLALLLPLIPKGSKGTKATVIIGTVQGDVHEIGKNIVSSMLMAGGFNVIDLGVDVKTINFIEEARKADAKIIGASALMSSTIGSQKDIVDYLVSSGDRKKHAVLVGGGPTTKEWAKEIGADACGMTAVEAVKLATKFAKGR
ncbi:MAG: cobalamin-dependent protein [Thermoplasmata archaeon]|jgi:trimethylamine corrinoid protein|nr:cobalamin-dependent protein [Thermoplasmata archaeon]